MKSSVEQPIYHHAVEIEVPTTVNAKPEEKSMKRFRTPMVLQRHGHLYIGNNYQRSAYANDRCRRETETYSTTVISI